jgi:S1-C subfamily serine protease
MEARQAAARRRARRRNRAGASLVGAAAAAGLVWLAAAGPTSVGVTADVVPLSIDNSDADAPSTSLVAGLFALGDAPAHMILVRSSDSAEMLASGMVVRDSYLITSGQAIGGATEVLVSWGSQSSTGVLIGHDEATDIAVIRISADPPSEIDTDGQAVDSGDVITIELTGGAKSKRTVINGMSSTALEDGAPIVGVIELDGRIGEITPGSPAYDESGALVGVTSATMDSAPAAMVPIAVARAVADDIIDGGEANHPRLGVRARTNDDDPSGSLILAVTVDGPASAGGVEIGDVIVAIDETPIDSVDAMVATLRLFEPGDAITVIVERDGSGVLCAVSLDSVADAAA